MASELDFANASRFPGTSQASIWCNHIVPAASAHVDPSVVRPADQIAIEHQQRIPSPIALRRWQRGVSPPPLKIECRLSQLISVSPRGGSRSVEDDDFFIEHALWASRRSLRELLTDED